MKKRSIIIGAIAVVSAVLFVGYIQGEQIDTTYYTYDVDQVDEAERVKLAQLTDVHSLQSEQRRSEILKIIEREKPTHIMLTGDIVTLRSTGDDNIKSIYPFLEALTKQAPVYFVSGNHEYDDNLYGVKVDRLSEIGIKVLNDQYVDLNQHIRLIGVEDVGRVATQKQSEADYQAMKQHIVDVGKKFVDQSKYNVLLYHRPHYMEGFQEGGFNLVLTGHVHGGQWQDPTHSIAAIAPDQGIFPKYFRGEYKEKNVRVISNRGLDFTTTLPRFYNAREIVFAEIK